MTDSSGHSNNSSTPPHQILARSIRTLTCSAQRGTFQSRKARTTNHTLYKNRGHPHVNLRISLTFGRGRPHCFLFPNKETDNYSNNFFIHF